MQEYEKLNVEMIGKRLRYGGLFMDISESEVGMKRGRERSS